MSDKVTFSVTEFNTIQQELVSLKQSKYELTEQVKKCQAEITKYKLMEKEYQKVQTVINKSKEKGIVQKLTNDVENLQKTIEMINVEHREQSEALRNNVQLMLLKNKEMNEEKDDLSKERTRLEGRIVDMKKQGKATLFHRIRFVLFVLFAQKLKDGSPLFFLGEQLLNFFFCGWNSLEMLHNEFRRRVQQALEDNQALYSQIFGSGDGDEQSEQSATTTDADAESHDGTNDESQSTASSETTSSSTNNDTLTKRNTTADHQSADQDLLNNISRLETELASQKKHYEKEIHNLEQQIEVWKEKHKKRLEIEQELATSHENIAKLNSQLSDQQLLVTQLLDEREKANRDNQEIISRMSAVQEERANLLTSNDSLNQRLQNLQKQLTTANQMRDKMRKDSIDLSKKISDMEKTEESLKSTLEQYKRYKDDLDSVTENFSTLQQNHKSSLSQLAAAQNENTRLKDTCRELDIIKQKLEQAEKKVARLTQTHSENTKQLKKLMENNKLYHYQLEETSKTLIHHFVESTIASWSTKVLMNDYESLQHEASKVPGLIARVETAEADSSKWQLKVKDTKTEYLLELKKNKNLVKELRSQLQSIQSEQQKGMDKGSPRRVQSFQDTPSSGFDSPRAMIRTAHLGAHSRTSSNTSIGSPMSAMDPSSAFNSPSATSQQATLEQLQKDNNILLTKIGELQQNKWNLTERVRHLEESVMLMQEDMEKKQTIIQHYTERERTGRIAPEQERFAQNMKRKQEQKTGTSSTAAVNPDAYKHMQQVMQETLLHNIQLQRDIRTLGTEIARLQEKVQST